MYLVGFVIRNYHEARSPERQIPNPPFVKFIESIHVILLGMADVCYCPVFESVTTVKQIY